MTKHNTDPVPTTTTNDWATCDARYKQQRAEALPINRAAVFAALTTGGVTHVIVCFDGYGDSGQIENVEAKAGDATVELASTEVAWIAPVWGRSDPERARIPLAEAIENVVYDCLEEIHAGWANCDGAYGDVTFDVTARTVTLDCNERHMVSDHTHHVW